MEKKCVDCKKLLPLRSFHKRQNYNKTTTKYYNSVCRDCMTIRSTQWRKKNPKRYAEYQKEYHKNRTKYANKKT